MNIIIHHSTYDQADFLDQFLDSYFSTHMEYQASELLTQGLSTTDINEAVKKAVTAGQTAGLDIRRHFYPLYTQGKYGLIRDCKLSKLGYALVLLNANVKIPVVANWQVKVLERYL